MRNNEKRNREHVPNVRREFEEGTCSRRENDAIVVLFFLNKQGKERKKEKKKEKKEKKKIPTLIDHLRKPNNDVNDPLFKTFESLLRRLIF